MERHQDRMVDEYNSRQVYQLERYPEVGRMCAVMGHRWLADCLT